MAGEKRKSNGLVKFYAACAREAKEKGLSGSNLVEYVGKCLLRSKIEQREAKKGESEDETG